jgi:hypothetical protein
VKRFRDDRVDAGLNTGSVMSNILFAIFVPGQTTPLVPGIKVITKLAQSLQPLLAFMPKASSMELQRKYYGTCGVGSL